MDAFTTQQLSEALQKLPPAIREIVVSIDHSDVFQEIMEQHGLTVAQIAAVAGELAPVAVGLVSPEALPRNLRRQLPELSEDRFNALLKGIDELYLEAIRDNIIAFAHEQKYKTSDAPVPTPASAPATATIPQHTTSTSIAQARLSGSAHIPSDTVRVQEVPRKPASPVENGRYTQGADPYREPIG